MSSKNNDWIFGDSFGKDVSNDLNKHDSQPFRPAKPEQPITPPSVEQILNSDDVEIANAGNLHTEDGGRTMQFAAPNFDEDLTVAQDTDSADADSFKSDEELDSAFLQSDYGAEESDSDLDERYESGYDDDVINIDRDLEAVDQAAKARTAQPQPDLEDATVTQILPSVGAQFSNNAETQPLSPIRMEDLFSGQSKEPDAAPAFPDPNQSSKVPGEDSEELEAISLEEAEAMFAERSSSDVHDSPFANIDPMQKPPRPTNSAKPSPAPTPEPEFKPESAPKPAPVHESSHESSSSGLALTRDSSSEIQFPDPDSAVESSNDSSAELEAISPEEALNMLGGPAEEKPGSGAVNRQDSNDVRQVLETNSEAMTLRNLAKRGVKNVRVMDLAALQRIMMEAVEKCLSRRSESLSAEERAKLEADAKKEFFELLEENKKLSAEKSEAEKARQSLQGQVDELNKALSSQEKLLAEENKRHDQMQEVRFSEESFTEMDEHIQGEFRRLVDVELKAAMEAGSDNVNTLETLGESISDKLRELLAKERELAIGAAQAEHLQRVRILETRIRKLNNALSSTEGALKKVASMKTVDAGIASVYSSVQGLSLDDDEFEKKSELLKVIFLENLELQGKEVTDEDLDVNIEPDAEKVQEADNLSLDTLPDGFMAPLDVDDFAAESAF